MTHKLVIVESPAKARTVANYLGPDYTVRASVGHVRDLPRPSDLPDDMKKGPYGRFAVDVEGDFTPYYVVNPDKRKIIADLRRELKKADELYLATDEDREGEAIAWHLLQVLKPKIPVKRMVFHEITKEAITAALTQTRDVDTDLVYAQETRRILDRLVGYEISPVLWRKVRRGLSAGRVQSVATRLVVERERERIAFVPATYCDISATFAPDSAEHPFVARLQTMDSRRFATGRDFADDGTLKPAKAGQQPPLVMDKQLAGRLLDAIPAATGYRVVAVDSKPYRRRPAPPFTTSTLQQEAGRKLRMTSRDTMRTAQTLYENGFITYMRTDSTALSHEAVDAARAQARQLYGADSVPAKPRIYAKKAKGAQEAHEAIRPAGHQFRSPDQVAAALGGAELRLYTLIWKRTVASQMVDATGTTDTVRVGGRVVLDDQPHDLEFSASGTVIAQRGFLAAYEEGQDRSRYDQDNRSDRRLPRLRRDQALDCTDVDRDNYAHTTTPPPRYTEASLVKALEERGIGRPSTYAATISVIIDRGYVHHRGQALQPSWLAFAVTRLLEDHFGELVDYDFTATMESDLDQIAAGRVGARDWLRRFYLGSGAATGGADTASGNDSGSNSGTHAGDEGAAPAAAGQTPLEQYGLKHRVENLGDIDARATNSMDMGGGVTLRVGRYGPYLEGPEQQRASVPDDLAPDELTGDVIAQLFERAAAADRVLGTDPDTGRDIVVKDGRFGPYVCEVLPEPADGAEDAATTAKGRRKAAAPKPRTASLFKDMDPATIDLPTALKLLSLPRVVGTDPQSGEEITAQNGRYGPYLKRGSDSRSLESEEQIFSVTLEQALEVYKQPKRRGRAAAKPPLKELGTDPVSEKPVVVKDGRWGPYITDGQTNVTVPRGTPLEELSAEQAYQLLADKRAKGPAKRRATRRKSATTKRKSATKTKRQTTAKKAPRKSAK